jgi:hypothetical protein
MRVLESFRGLGKPSPALEFEQGWMFDVRPGYPCFNWEAWGSQARAPHRSSSQATVPAGRRNLGLSQNCFNRTVQLMPRTFPANGR